MLQKICDADTPAIASLMNRAYRNEPDGPSWTSEARIIAGDRTTAKLLKADLRDKPEGAMLKWIDNRHGLCACVWVEQAGPELWYLGSLAVEPSLQSIGLGKAVLDAAEQQVRKLGGMRIRITVVNVRAPLIAWYERRGYRLTGDAEPFPHDDDRFGTPMRSDLSFLAMEKILVQAQGSGR